MASKEKGECRVCGRDIRLKSDGYVWPHGLPISRCPGGGKAPARKELAAAHERLASRDEVKAARPAQVAVPAARVRRCCPEATAGPLCPRHLFKLPQEQRSKILSAWHDGDLTAYAVALDEAVDWIHNNPQATPGRDAAVEETA